MVVGIKDSLKLVGISVVAFCAVFVCSLFINYGIDLSAVKPLIDPNNVDLTSFYTALQSTSIVVCLLSGGCLLATSVVMLLFYVKNYIDSHKKELGILKALGKSNMSIAWHFWVFGGNVLIGAALGFGCSFGLMPAFYHLQNHGDKNIPLGFPEVVMNFHVELLIYLVIIPAIVFAALSVFYAALKLRKPVLALIKDDTGTGKTVRRKDKITDRPFLRDLKTSVLKSKKILVFFIVFAAFCFSAMTQMSASMKDLSSPMMGAIMLVIGIALAVTTFMLSVTAVIKGNTKTIAMMRVMGYCQADCRRAILGVYRPFAYVGFAIGTGYQFGLLKLMVAVVFKDIADLKYNFDWVSMLISLASFVVLYELSMLIFGERIKRIPLRSIMIE